MENEEMPLYHKEWGHAPAVEGMGISQFTTKKKKAEMPLYHMEWVKCLPITRNGELR